jgi:hypothetical protein
MFGVVAVFGRSAHGRGQDVFSGIVPRCSDLAGRSVVEPRVGAVVAVMNAVISSRDSLVEGLELVAPDAAFLELGDQGSMNAEPSGSR